MSELCQLDKLEINYFQQFQLSYNIASKFY
jgi:hypothetical protein